MTDAELKIETMIQAIWRRWLLQQVGCFGPAGVSVLFVWLLVIVVLDNVAMLSPGGFMIGWGSLLLAALGLAAVVAYRLRIRRPGADRLALMYESRVRGVRNRLINSVQFLHSRQADRDPMARAVIAENAQVLDLPSASLAVTLRPVRDMMIAAGVCAALLFGYAGLRPAWTANALSRLLHPLHPGAHLLATEPTVSPGDVQLIEGQPLRIRATVRPSARGHLPNLVALEYRVGNLGWTGTAMAAASPTEFRYEFPAVRHPIEYRVRAGRSVSPDYHATVQYRPHVEHLQVVVTRPAYAGGGSRELKPDTGERQALAGSTVEVRVTASVPLSRGWLEVANRAKVPLNLDSSDPGRGTARFGLARSGSYAVWLADTAGLPNIDPPRYTLTAEMDQPPAAVVTNPGRDLILPVNSAVPLAIEADDDIGLARVVLQTRIGNGEWKDAEQWEVAGKNVRHHTTGTYLSLKDLGLKVNDVLLYRAVAYDRREPQPNVGTGRSWSVTVAEPNDDQSLLAALAKRLLEGLRQLLALQRENRTEVDMDRAVEPIRARQEQIRQLTLALIEQQRKSLRPTQSIIDELVDLANGPMPQAIQSLARYEGTYQQRLPLKAPILKLMDLIIGRLEALIGRVEQSVASAEKSQKTLEQLAPQEREQALKRIRDLLEKLRDFIPQQDKVIAKTEELVRKGEDLTDKDLQKLEELKGTEDRWARVFTDSVKDISKLTEQGFADRSLADDYKEMVEQIEEASKNLNPKLIEMAVPREQAGRELATALAEEMEMWLPNSPDYIKWMMEEPLDKPEIPMVDLPDQLSDLIGDLIEQQDELNDAAEDMTSAWADSISAAGWLVSDGPISNFSAVGKTGSQLPDNQELSGRSGDGRSGRSQGQLVEDVAKGLQGRPTPTRITNDPYEQGVVKELQQMAAGGATGGGKARGAGQEGLQGQSPPPLMKDLQFMKDWQQRIRQQAERVAGQAREIRINSAELNAGIALMKQAETAAGQGRYADLFRIQQMVLQSLKRAVDPSAREVTLSVDRAMQLPAGQGREILDAMDEPVPQEYEGAVWRYFQQLSEAR